MMMELSCSSSPISIHSPVNQLHRRAYLHSHRRNVAFLWPSSCSSASTSTSSSSSSFYGFSISRKTQNLVSSKGSRPSRTNRLFYVACGVFEKFTERAVKAVMFSQREAKALGAEMVFTQHLLLGLIAEDRAAGGFLGSGIKVDVAREVVKRTWHSVGDSGGDGGAAAELAEVGSATDMPFSPSTKRVFEAAVEYSRTMGYNFIAPEHIAIGLFTVDDGSAGRVLKRLGANVNYLAAEAVTRLEGELIKDGRVPPAVLKRAREKSTSTSKNTTLARSSPRAVEKKKSALDQFCVDLTARASEGRIDPVIGRETEVQRIVQILCRRTKNNAILLGEAGVGKTAIAEGLAIRIAEGNVPVNLYTKRIMSLDIGLLIAGAKERGELESRVTTLLKEVKKSGNVIVFIDEVHALIGSGTAGKGNKGSGLDMSNLLKPALGRGELQCIASTTMDEFRLHFETDKAMARRFQPVLITEPSEEDAVQILLGLREKYELHHKCRFTTEAIDAAVNLSARYIPDRHLPDKAIDLMDEAGSKARMDAHKRRKEQQTLILSKSPSEYWQEIRSAQTMHEVLESPFKEVNTSNISKPTLPSNHKDDETTMVGPEDIAAVASLWSGIPVQKLTADERKQLIGLEEQLKRRVVGQDEAVVAISRAVKRSRVGLKDPKRPIAAMLFCGPTGVGKTELTKALAASYFGSETDMLRLDMSEYMERHTVSKLIGSPPGYVGYGEGGTLTEAIRRKPFTVVLLDEIEKAHPDIFNILLQLFEDGHLTDSQGRRVSFKNSMIVMTSNVGSTAIAKGRRNSIGFIIDNDVNASYAGMKALVMEELKAYFRPELLNRMDEVVVFRPLEKTQMLEISNMMLEEVKKRIDSLGFGLEVSEAVMDLVCEEGFDRSYGARPLRRAIARIIEDPLSESLLLGGYRPGDIAMVHLDDSGNSMITNKSRRSIHLSDTSSVS